jgi:hypothetical protein
MRYFKLIVLLRYLRIPFGIISLRTIHTVKSRSSQIVFLHWPVSLPSSETFSMVHTYTGYGVRISTMEYYFVKLLVPLFHTNLTSYRRGTTLQVGPGLRYISLFFGQILGTMGQSKPVGSKYSSQLYYDSPE